VLGSLFLQLIYSLPIIPNFFLDISVEVSQLIDSLWNLYFFLCSLLLGLHCLVCHYLWFLYKYQLSSQTVSKTNNEENVLWTNLVAQQWRKMSRDFKHST
jgi:hypothetical protein